MYCGNPAKNYVWWILERAKPVLYIKQLSFRKALHTKRSSQCHVWFAKGRFVVQPLGATPENKYLIASEYPTKVGEFFVEN